MHSLMEQARYVSYAVDLGLFHAWISLMESCIIFVPHEPVLSKFWVCFVLLTFVHLHELLASAELGK